MKNFIAICSCLLFLLASCDKNDTVIPPEEEKEEEKEPIEKIEPDYEYTKKDSLAKEKLVGVWAMIYNGFGEDKDTYTDTLSIVEFLPDGIYRKFSKYTEKYVDQFTYKISPEYYYLNSISDRPISHGGKWVYKYKFYDDKFRIDLLSGITTYHTAYIFKRLE